jgi:hypothetical protein
MRHLDEYLTNAELTQCAHRNRPLRQDGRIILTLCQGEIAYLPVTETILSLPLLEEGGVPRATAEERLEAAYQEMRGQGETCIARPLSLRATVRYDVARVWLKERQAQEGQREDQVAG